MTSELDVQQIQKINNSYSQILHQTRNNLSSVVKIIDLGRNNWLIYTTIDNKIRLAVLDNKSNVRILDNNAIQLMSHQKGKKANLIAIAARLCKSQ